MESELRGIGETARACGLTVTALRFYDRVGVLVPAVVDPATGYRRYAEHQIRPARLLAGLRRVGMPLADIQAPAGQASAQPLDHDFPDYRRVLGDRLRRDVTHRLTVDVPTLRAALTPGTAPTVVREHHGTAYDVAILAVAADGTLDVVREDSWHADDPNRIAVNREFLLQALAATGHTQLVLELDGPITPLALRIPDSRSSLSVLMPVRL
jgi:DNA-binding transcriptional MerR regulator